MSKTTKLDTKWWIDLQVLDICIFWIEKFYDFKVSKHITLFSSYLWPCCHSKMFYILFVVLNVGIRTVCAIGYERMALIFSMHVGKSDFLQFFGSKKFKNFLSFNYKLTLMLKIWGLILRNFLVYLWCCPCPMIHLRLTPKQNSSELISKQFKLPNCVQFLF